MRRTASARRCTQLRCRAGLHRLDDARAHRVAGRRVAETRDLPLVAEHADEQNPGRRITVSAKSAASAGVRSGDRQVPTWITGP